MHRGPDDRSAHRVQRLRGSLARPPGLRPGVPGDHAGVDRSSVRLPDPGQEVGGFRRIQLRLERLDFALQLGSVQETITIAGKDAPTPADNSGRDIRRRSSAPPCGATPSVDGVAIGGNVRPPIKLRDVRPEYPAALRSSGVEGTGLVRFNLGTSPALLTEAVDRIAAALPRHA